MPDALEALREECELVSKTALALPEEDFAKPTRLPAWNVKELLGHMAHGIERMGQYLDAPAPAQADTDSVDYWTRYDPAVDSPAVADRGKAFADRYATGRELAEAWDEAWRRNIQRASTEDRLRLVQVVWGPALTLDEYLKTRVLEATVHRMDLENALGSKGWGTDDAVAIVDEILVDLLGDEPPTDLDWDVVDFIETGTGRRQLTDEEREILGDMADRFPLLA